MCEVPFLVLIGGLSSSSLCLMNILQIYADWALHILMSVVDINTFPNPSASRPMCVCLCVFVCGVYVSSVYGFCVMCVFIKFTSI